MATKRKKTPAKAYRDDWEGLPLLRIEGSFRPFRVSRAKCEAILEVLDQIRAFVEELRKAEELRISRAATPEEWAVIEKYIPNPHPHP